jgi:hypothetical protein
MAIPELGFISLKVRYIPRNGARQQRHSTRSELGTGKGKTRRKLEISQR